MALSLRLRSCEHYLIFDVAALFHVMPTDATSLAMAICSS